MSCLEEQQIMYFVKNAINSFNLNNKSEIKFKLDSNFRYWSNDLEVCIGGSTIENYEFAITMKNKCERISTLKLFHSFIYDEDTEYKFEFNVEFPCDFQVYKVVELMNIIKIYLKKFENKNKAKEQQRLKEKEEKRLSEEAKINCYLLAKNDIGEVCYKFFASKTEALQHLKGLNQGYIVKADEKNYILLILDWENAIKANKPFVADEGSYYTKIDFLSIKENGEVIK